MSSAGDVFTLASAGKRAHIHPLSRALASFSNVGHHDSPLLAPRTPLPPPPARDMLGQAAVARRRIATEQEKRMMGKNGRYPDDDDEPLDMVDDEELAEEGEYDTLMLLDRLESLEDEMRELGVNSLDELQTRIRDLHAQMDG